IAGQRPVVAEVHFDGIRPTLRTAVAIDTAFHVDEHGAWSTSLDDGSAAGGATLDFDLLRISTAESEKSADMLVLGQLAFVMIVTGRANEEVGVTIGSSAVPLDVYLARLDVVGAQHEARHGCCRVTRPARIYGDLPVHEILVAPAACKMNSRG